MSPPLVIGLDLSLTGTGVARRDGTRALRPTKVSGFRRLRWLRDQVFDLAESADLVVVEGPAYSSTSGHVHERGGLWWMALEPLDQLGIPIGVVPPACLKKYATGKGNADKDAVILACSRRFEDFAGGNDEADAMWLCAMGHDQLGDPLVDMPQVNRGALNGCAWPAEMPAQLASAQHAVR